VLIAFNSLLVGAVVKSVVVFAVILPHAFATSPAT